MQAMITLNSFTYPTPFAGDAQVSTENSQHNRRSQSTWGSKRETETNRQIFGEVKYI